MKLKVKQCDYLLLIKQQRKKKLVHLLELPNTDIYVNKNCR